MPAISRFLKNNRNLPTNCSRKFCFSPTITQATISEFSFLWRASTATLLRKQSGCLVLRHAETFSAFDCVFPRTTAASGWSIATAPAPQEPYSYQADCGEGVYSALFQSMADSRASRSTGCSVSAMRNFGVAGSNVICREADVPLTPIEARRLQPLSGYGHA
jgi:hypothetical protein